MKNARKNLSRMYRIAKKLQRCSAGLSFIDHHHRRKMDYHSYQDTIIKCQSKPAHTVDSSPESFLMLLQCLSLAIKLHWWWWGMRMKKTLTRHKMVHKDQGEPLSADEKANGEAEPCFMTSLGCNGAMADEEDEDFFLLVDTGGRYITLSSLRSIEAATAPGG